MSAPYRSVALGPSEVQVERGADGSVWARSPHPLDPYPERFSERLFDAARSHPERLFVAARDAKGEWRGLTYGLALERVLAVAGALLARGLGPERPLAILSGSSPEHAVLALAAMHVGIPYAPISPAYSLASGDLARLRHVLELLSPGLVFAQSGTTFARALTEALAPQTMIVCAEAPPPGCVAEHFEELLAGTHQAAVQAASTRVGPESVAKILFTSGSTGTPKGVINTQRMLCCNQQMFEQALPLVAAQPPVLLDWLPWHHSSGGNQILGLTVYHAGTLYLDEGRPTPEQIGATVRNLREIAPTLYFTAPRGYAELIPYLERDRSLRERFFSRVGMLYYSGAALSEAVVQRLEALAEQTCGERIPMICGYGSTETGPFALCANWLTSRSGLAGLPVPGVTLKLVPRGDKLEACIRGPNVTPGYWGDSERTRAAFDAEGFLLTGDALRWVDARDVSQGLAFDGRLAEDFKLTSGTWVSTAALRARLIAAAAPLIHDVVITGENRDEVGALIFPDISACRALCERAGTVLEGGDWLASASVRDALQRALDQIGRERTGSSTFIARALVLTAPASSAHGELTDKGSISQRAVLTHRARELQALYAEPAPASVLRVGTKRAGDEL